MGNRYHKFNTALRGLRRHALTGALLPVLFCGGSFATPVIASEPPTSLARQLNDAFADAAEKVMPAVVVIDVVQNSGAPDASVTDQDIPDGFPPEIWRYFRDRYGSPGGPSPGEGSGVIIRADGYILTNGHVVENASSIRVRLKDGRTFSGRLRGIDPQSDLAVIKIDADKLPVARLGDSGKIRVGEFVIAIGAPYNLDFSVSIGHLSAKNRANVIQGRGTEQLEQDYLQTDALMNPGNSGGPLLNLGGEVVGINTMIRGIHTGIGFAIPSNLAREISDRLIADGKFPRPWLGVEIRSVRDAAELDPSITNTVSAGVVISRIIPDSPASMSDLKKGDIITSVGSTTVQTGQDLRKKLRGSPLGKELTLGVFRPGTNGTGESLKLPVTPAEWKPAPKPMFISGTALKESFLTEMGITVHILTAEIASQFGIEQTNGVLVLGVQTNSPAHRSLQLGDVIDAVEKHPIAKPRKFSDDLKAGDLRKGITLSLIRRNKPLSVVLKEGSD